MLINFNSDQQLISFNKVLHYHIRSTKPQRPSIHHSVRPSAIPIST